MAQNENNAQDKASELTQLLACPFCGSSEVYGYDRPLNNYEIICIECQNRTGVGEKHDCISSWNKRTG
ncbi:MAG: Lar family restriction alleviation protein [Bacteroidota bacterium]